MSASSAVLWFPSVGLGFIAVAWFGWPGLILALVNMLLTRWIYEVPVSHEMSLTSEVILTGWELGLGWFCYRSLARGERRINDPRSATSFLLIIPVCILVCSSYLRSLLTGESFLYLWLGMALSVLALTPTILFFATPWLVRLRLIDGSPDEDINWVDLQEPTTFGDGLETVGLALAGGVLGFLVTQSHLLYLSIDWRFWSVLLLLVVWASLRQGLRGGTMTSLTSTLVALLLTPWFWENPSSNLVAFSSLQGNFLALCSTAILVGASAGWIRASESRYRSLMGHLPVVLYSARFGKTSLPREELPPIQLVLVNPAVQEFFGRSPSTMVGSYDKWLRLILPDDQELLRAAILQMVRDGKPISCEYRLAHQGKSPSTLADVASSRNTFSATRVRERWVRDTLVPVLNSENKMIGWEGVVEDISTQRVLASELQSTTTMLHTLVANLPAGVFFVHGSEGHPILVNNRARQLLGQREVFSASITVLPNVYRLHKPDGSLYPAEELPVFQALKNGLTSMRDDIVVHRADGRQIPLIAWGAPIDLDNSGQENSLRQGFDGKTQPRPISAAVWVFEDLTSLQQAEAARIDSEARLRSIVEALEEGIIIQNEHGNVIDCNPAACRLLARSKNDILHQGGLIANDTICWQENGEPLARGDMPDRVCLRQGIPVVNAIIGVCLDGNEEPENRTWFRVSSRPLASRENMRPGLKNRIITIFSDITPQLQGSMHASDKTM